MLVVQGLFMSLTFWGIYKIAGLFFEFNKAAVTTILSYGVLLTTYGFGNYTEEYSLVFIVFSIYLGMKYFLEIEEKEEGHPWQYAVWYGISFMCIAFMRVTNAIAICCLIAVILLHLVLQKQWMNILQNVLAFFGGGAMAFLSVSLYFACKHAWYDMIYGTFIHNVLYAGKSGIMEGLGERWRVVVVALFTTGMLLGISIVFMIVKKKKSRLIGIYGILVSVVSCILFFRINRYLHYYIITLPYFVLAAGMTEKMKQDCKEKILGRGVYTLACMLIVVQVILTGIKIPKQIERTKEMREYGQDYARCSHQLMSYIPEEEKEEVLVFGTNDLSQFYLLEDLKPIYKYFILQDWMSGTSDSIKEEIKNYLQNTPPKWLIIDAEKNTENIQGKMCETFKNIIEEKYELVDSEKMKKHHICMQVYRLKQ